MGSFANSFRQASLLALLSASISACAWYPRPIHDSRLPLMVQDGGLLIGCVIVQPERRFRGTRHVLVLGHLKSSDTTRQVELIPIEADSAGFWVHPGASPGIYWIHSVHCTGGSDYWRFMMEENLKPGPSFLYRPFRGEESWIARTEYRAERTDIDKLPLDSLPTVRDGEICDFGFLILDWVSDGIYTVPHHRMQRIDTQLLEPVRWSHPLTVPEYFMKTYPKSEWASRLSRLVK